MDRLLFVHVAGALVLAASTASSDLAWVSVLWLGLVFSQFSLLAVWAALGEGNHILRMLGSAAILLVLAWFYFDVIDPRRASATNLPQVAAVIEWLGLQVVLWGRRLWLGERITRRPVPAAVDSAPESPASQFTVRQLFAWTTIVALLIAYLRLLQPEWQARRELVAFLVFALGNLLLVRVTLLSALRKEKSLAQLLGVSLTAAMLMSFGQGFVVSFFSNPNGLASAAVTFVLTSANLTQVLVLIGTGRTLRDLGYRLA